MSAAQLGTPILDGGIRAVNFFNGRLLTGEDLSRERDGSREISRRLGQALGDGVVFGLEVVEAPGVSSPSAPVLRVAAGLGVNRRGTCLTLSEPTDLLMVPPATTVAVGVPNFAACQPPQATTPLTTGVYLLVLAPARSSEGSVPVSAVTNTVATCNTRYTVEGVQFRRIQLPLSNADLQQGDTLRNDIAYRFFGSGDAGYLRSLQDPFSIDTREYGLLATLRSQSVLSDCDVPLCVFSWTAGQGIDFIDLWAVRRRLTQRDAVGPWPLYTGNRRAIEGEAMFLQFQDHASRVAQAPGVGAVAVDAVFRTLPPLGLLPVRTPAVNTGFDLATFFGNHRAPDVALIDADQLRALAHEAIDHEPIVLADQERIQVYLLWETVQAQEQFAATQMTAVFANRTLPYRGAARYGFGGRTARVFARYGLSRYVAARFNT